MISKHITDEYEELSVLIGLFSLQEQLNSTFLPLQYDYTRSKSRPEKSLIAYRRVFTFALELIYS
jgi:hypothetical protein